VCAGRQGKFWGMHEALYADQKRLDEPSLLARAHRLNLDMDRFRTCLAGEALQEVREDARGAEALGLSGTPAFLLGTRQSDGRVHPVTVLTGARPFADFQKAINALLAGAGRAQTSEPKWSWVVALIAAGIAAGAQVRRPESTAWRG
jgi:protein-disulfide isomerase